LAVFEHLSQQVALQIVQQLGMAQNQPLVLSLLAKGDTAACWLLEQAFLEALDQRGFSRIFLKRPEFRNPGSGFLLEVFLETMLLRYQTVQRGWFRKSLVERQVELGVLARVTQLQDGQLVDLQAARKEYKDQIPMDRVKWMEDPSLPFTQGTWLSKKPGSWYRRWLEPTLLFSVSGVIVYLFFSIRSR